MRILVVVSDTDSGLRQVRLALSMACGSSTEVIALCVTDGEPVAFGIGASIGPGAEALLMPVPIGPASTVDLAAEVARSVGDGADGVFAVLTAEGTVRGVVPGAVAELDPDLLVLPGMPPRGRIASWLLGDDHGHLIPRSEVPVLLAREEGAGSDTVLVVVEDVRPSGDAVRAVASLPLPHGARVVLLGLLPAGGGAGRARHRQRMVRRLDAARSMLSRAGRHPSVLVHESTAVEELLSTVDRLDAGIVVVASAHLGGRHRLSGLADGLVRRSGRSVMVVPTSLQRRRRIVPASRSMHRHRPPAGSTRSVL